MRFRLLLKLFIYVVIWSKYLCVTCLDVLVDPVDDGINVSDDDGDGRRGTEAGGTTSSEQTVQDVSLEEGITKVVLEENNVNILLMVEVRKPLRRC